MNIFKRDIVEKLFIAGIVLGVALYPKFPFLLVPGTSVRIRIEDFLLGLMGVYVAFKYFKSFKTQLMKPLERRVLLFFAIGTASLASAIFITQSIVPHIGVLHLFRRVEYFIPLFFALTLKRDRTENYTRFLTKLLLITVFYAFIFGFGQKYFSWPVILTQNEQYSKGVALRFLPGAHLVSTFAGHYDLASFLVLVLPVLALCFFFAKAKWEKLVFLFVTLAGVWTLSGTLSRISIVAYLVAIVIAFALVRKFKALVLTLVVSMVIFSFSTNLFDRYLRIIEVTKSRLEKVSITLVSTAHAQDLPQRVFEATPIPPQVMVFEDRSTSIRLNVEWPRAIRAFTKNPLLGTGYSSITLATDNDYLRALGEVGILGFLSFGLILASIFYYIKKVYKLVPKLSGVEKAFVAGFSGSFFGLLINAVFIDIFEASKFAIIFWLIAGMFVYLMRTKTDNKNA